MSEFILLRLDQEFRPSTWLRCDVASGPMGFSQSASVAMPAGLKVIAVCASAALALRFVQTPKQGRERFRQAIAFALEDSVANDVDELSFVLPLQLEDGLQPVAVLAKAQLAQMREQLSTLSTQPVALVPLPSLLPPDTVWVERSLSSFRFGNQSSENPGGGPQEAGSLESESLSALLKLKQNGDGNLPLHILLNDGISFPKLPNHFSVEAVSEPNHYLAARLLAQTQLLSLTAPESAPRNRFDFKLAPRWRLAAGLALATLLLQGFALLHDYFGLSRQLAEQNQEIAGLYQQLYPNGPKSLDPVAMLLSKLKSEQSESAALSGGGALSLLRRIAPVLYTETRLNLIRAEYRSGELELSFRSPDLATIDALRARLATLSGLEVSLGNNNIDPNGQMLTGRIKLKEIG
jgi:general secretion pathway protein L